MNALFEGGDTVRIAPYQPFPPFDKWRPVLPDDSTFASYVQLLDDTRAQATEADLEAALRIATRSAAVDTGAIEGLYQVDRGFTRTVAVEAAAWQGDVAAKGKSVELAIADALATYDMVLDAATSLQPVTESWIRQLHARICASVDTFTVQTPSGPQAQALPKGQYKQQPNSPTRYGDGTVHEYAPVLDTPPEMQRLVQELSSPAFASSSPLAQASYAHYAFVCVHPFSDGNGRVARALASVYLYRNPGVPLVVFADQKGAYLDSLEMADAGSYGAFAAFIAERVVDTIELIRLDIIRGRAERDQRSAIEELSLALDGGGGVSHQETDALALRILDALDGELQKQATALGLPKGTKVNHGRGHGFHTAAPQGFRVAHSAPQYLLLELSSEAPADTKVAQEFAVFVSMSGPREPGGGFLVFAPGLSEPLPLTQGVVYPSFSSIAHVKIEAWVGAQLALIVKRLAEQVKTRLKDQGYLPSEP